MSFSMKRIAPLELAARRCDRRRHGRVGALRLGLRDLLDELVVVERPGCRHDDVARHVASAQKSRRPSAGVPATTSARPMIAPAQRVRAEDRLAEHVEDLVLRVVLVHRDLLEDDLALVVEVVLREARPPDHVGHHVQRPLEVHVEHARVDRRRLLAGPRVELRAHAVEDLVDLHRLEARRPAEQHVLDQVGQAGLGLRLADGPVPIQNPSATERTRGIRSVTTRTPESSSVIRCVFDAT